MQYYVTIDVDTKTVDKLTELFTKEKLQLINTYLPSLPMLCRGLQENNTLNQEYHKHSSAWALWVSIPTPRNKSNAG